MLFINWSFLSVITFMISHSQIIKLPSDDAEKREDMLQKFHDFQRKADMYYAYHSIHRYTVSYPHDPTE